MIRSSEQHALVILNERRQRIGCINLGYALLTVPELQYVSSRTNAHIIEPDANEKMDCPVPIKNFVHLQVRLNDIIGEEENMYE